MSDIKFSLNPVTIPGCNYIDSFRIAERAGFHGVTFRYDLLNDYIQGNSLDDAKRIVDESKLSVTEAGFLYGWMFNNGIPLCGKRKANGESEKELIQTVDAFFERLKILGGPPVTALVSINEKGELKTAAKDLQKLSDRAAEWGLKIMVEFIGNSPQFNSIESTLSLIELADRDNIGILVDSFLMFMGSFDIENFSKIPKGKILTAHISDAVPGIEPAELDMLEDRVLPGEGVIPLVDFCTALFDTGYDGCLAVEIFNKPSEAEDPLALAVRTYKSMETLIERCSL